MPSVRRRLEADVITSDAMAPSGEAVAHAEIDGERRALLVRGGAPHESLHVAFDPSERPAHAEIVAIASPSEDRVQAPCEFTHACGGCDWMHLAHIAQRAQHLRLAEAVARGAAADSSAPKITFHDAPRDLACRARARFHAQGERGALRVGYFAPRSRDLVLVDRCIVLDPRVDEARGEIARVLGPGARGDGEISIALGTSRAVVDVTWSRDLPPDAFARADESVRSGKLDGVRVTCGQARRPAVFGDPTPWIAGADGAPLELAPGGFSQAHEGVNAELAAHVDASAKDAKKIVELYAGAGNLTVMLARGGRDVRAIESNEPACEAARRNLASRALVARVTCADAARFEIPNGTDCVVLDPPRTGARDACAALAKGPRSVARVVYVSCDRMTLARDLEILAPRFSLARLDVFDMFPHTSHAEIVAVLDRKRS